jgi:hypothetical protein
MNVARRLARAATFVKRQQISRKRHLALPLLPVESGSDRSDASFLQSPRRGFTVCALDQGKRSTMNRKINAIVVGGLIGGAFDIAYAIIFSNLRSGVAPSRILQSVASGLLGSDAYSGGTPTATLGLGLHFFMALLWAAAYVIAAGWVPLMARRPIIFGAAFGAFVYAFMNLVVIPLSRFPTKPSYPLAILATGLFVHMFLFGVPIALAARRAFATT